MFLYPRLHPVLSGYCIQNINYNYLTHFGCDLNHCFLNLVGFIGIQIGFIIAWVLGCFGAIKSLRWGLFGLDVHTAKAALQRMGILLLVSGN